MTSPHSLRDLYIDPASAWSFVPPVLAQSNATTTSSSAQPTPAYQWSTRPSHNSIFDLSPSLDLSEPSAVNAIQLLKALVASAVLQYASSSIIMPWEVGKLLLQVQWVPRDAGETELFTETAEEEEVVDDAVGTFSSVPFRS